MNSPISPKKNLRAIALGGTALALVLAGGVLGGTFDLVRPTPALAEPVQVQGVQIPSFADLVQKVSPAVVSVRVKEKQPQLSADNQDFPFQFQPGSPMERFFRQFRQMNPNDNNQPQQPRGFSMALGSGFFISEDGYLVTNNHVVDKGSSFTVVLDDGTELPAKVIGTDDKTDLALLKVNDPGHKFTYVKFADGKPRVGDWVVAVGNPFGLGGTVTAGIVSAEGRQIGGPYDNYIQIDAPVNRGNSGGPTFNVNGEVIGVNTAIYSPSGGSVGIAFDIPASTVSNVITDLMKHGSVVRGWLGVQIQTVDQGIADSLGLKQAEGAIVGEVTDGSPAAKAGFKVGDAITAVNGQQVKDSRDLALRISQMNPGSKVTVTYWRGGTSHDAEVTLGTLPKTQQLASADQGNGGGNQAMPSALKDFGLTLSPDTNAQDGGVVISGVDPTGQAAEHGLQPGDVILSVGAKSVNTPADVEKMVANAKAGGHKAVLLRIKSGDQTQFVALTFAQT
jgi:serine protease Do